MTKAGVTSATCEYVFRQLDDLGKRCNWRVYIGPGTDGSSDDEITIQAKFNSATAHVVPKVSRRKSYWRRTAFVSYDGCEWEKVEANAGLEQFTGLLEIDILLRVCIFFHPNENVVLKYATFGEPSIGMGLQFDIYI